MGLSMATKKKALTKRQILNELLLVEEKIEKHGESQARLWSRGEKLDDTRKALVEQLKVMGVKEQRKEGVQFPARSIKEPILFKKHVFAEIDNNYGNGTHLSIKAIKVVK